MVTAQTDAIGAAIPRLKRVLPNISVIKNASGTLIKSVAARLFAIENAVRPQPLKNAFKQNAKGTIIKSKLKDLRYEAPSFITFESFVKIPIALSGLVCCQIRQISPNINVYPIAVYNIYLALSRFFAPIFWATIGVKAIAKENAGSIVKPFNLFAVPYPAEASTPIEFARDNKIIKDI